MPAPVSNEELYVLIAKSGVMDDARLNAYLDRLRAADTLPTDPIKLGERMVADGQLTHFQAEQLLQGRWKRFSIGKYRVLERLGVGGMGQVFLCEHKLMKRKVAVKVLPAAKAKDEAALQRFYREARAVAAVDHPNIVRAYDIDDDDQLHFLVMEYVDGTNLYDLVRKAGPLPPLRACHYIYASAVGLEHAHEMGLVHRDIKPANILVDRTGVVKILDMGLARFFNPDDDDHITKKFDENVLGTADYLAPEQAVDSSSVTIRADIYGLGGTFYFMLTGQPPFPDGTIAQKLMWHQSRAPRPISDYRPDVPPQLAAVVDKMLAKNPDDRYQTPTEVMAALVGWVQTPIPPPTEEELPKMSVAAGGRAGDSAQTIAASGVAVAPTLRPQPQPAAVPLHGPVTTPRMKPASVEGSLPSLPKADPPAARPAKAVAVVTPPPAVPALPPPTPASGNVWADLRNGETLPAAQETTRPRRRNKNDEREDDDDKPARPARRKEKAKDRDRDDHDDDDNPARRTKKKKGSPLPWIIAAAVGGLLLVGGGAWAVMAVVFGKPPANTTPEPIKPTAEKRTWHVSKSGTGPNPATTRKTLAEVFRGLRSGDEILLYDETIEIPSLSLQGHSDLRIGSADPAKPTQLVYKPPAKPPTTPPPAVVLFDGCSGLTLSGVIVDASGFDVGIQVSGGAKGTKLENVTVKGAKKTAVLLKGVSADAENPLTLTGCRFVLPANGEAAVSVLAIKDFDTRGVKIDGCRMEGAGSGTGVRFEGTTSDVTMTNCRMWNFGNGVWFTPAPEPVAKLAVAVEHTTFFNTKAGVRVDTPATERKVEVRWCYFAGGGETAVVLNPKGVSFGVNGRDGGTQPGASKAEVAMGTLTAPPPDAPDDKFLKGKVTVGGKSVGAE